MNSNNIFSALLTHAVELKKLSGNKAVTAFIKEHEPEALTSTNLDEIEATPEIKEFAQIFFKKRMKCGDKQLLHLIDKFYTPEAPIVEKEHEVYSFTGQEY